MIERLIAAPDLLHHRQVLGGACITLVVGKKITVALLVFVGAATDHVYRQPSFAELVQGRQLPGRNGRRDETGTVRKHHPQALGVVQHVRGNLIVVRPGGKAADQQAIKAVGLGGVRHVFDVGLVDDRATGLDGFRASAVTGMTDEFETHDVLLMRVVERLQAQPCLLEQR
ncbi:hypothetical protein D3C72_899200 [compost metagenome]